jgi:hypothetical protein
MTTASHNLHSVPLSLRLDPWTPTYESAVQLEEDDGASPADVDSSVETSEWRPLLPDFVERPQTIAFIDGVQRVEMRLIGDDAGRMVYGALASVGVGASFIGEGDCGVQTEPPLRVLALSDGATYAPITVDCGNTSLEFRPQNTGESGLAAVHQALQDARSREEIRLGEQLDESGVEMVVVDGRLNWQPKRGTMVIGLVKTIHKRYLEQPQIDVLSKLAPRTRTPIFRIGGKHAVYSWYLRLTKARPMDHPWSGLVRLETLDSIPIEAAKRLADLTACHLPGFASSPAHDPRAPQNLYPIGGLEDRLRHSLGDHEWIRRHIEMHFFREYAT